VVSAQASAAHGRQPGRMYSCGAQTHVLLPSGYNSVRQYHNLCDSHTKIITSHACLLFVRPDRACQRGGAEGRRDDGGPARSARPGAHVGAPRRPGAQSSPRLRWGRTAPLM